MEHVYGNLSSKSSEITVEERQEQQKSQRWQGDYEEMGGHMVVNICSHSGCTAFIRLNLHKTEQDLP